MTKGSVYISLAVVVLLVIMVGGTLGLGWPIEWVIRAGVLCLVGSILFFLVRWHARSFAYECPRCKRAFAISILTDFISPHFPDQKYLKCPHCHERSWCHEVPMSAVPVQAKSERPN